MRPSLLSYLKKLLQSPIALSFLLFQLSSCAARDSFVPDFASLTKDQSRHSFQFHDVAVIDSIDDREIARSRGIGFSYHYRKQLQEGLGFGLGSTLAETSVDLNLQYTRGLTKFFLIPRIHFPTFDLDRFHRLAYVGAGLGASYSLMPNYLVYALPLYALRTNSKNRGRIFAFHMGLSFIGKLLWSLAYSYTREFDRYEQQKESGQLILSIGFSEREEAESKKGQDFIEQPSN